MGLSTSALKLRSHLDSPMFPLSNRPWNGSLAQRLSAGQGWIFMRHLACHDRISSSDVLHADARITRLNIDQPARRRRGLRLSQGWPERHAVLRLRRPAAGVSG